PSSTFRCPRKGSVVDGKGKTGKGPQISCPEGNGDRNSDGPMSPIAFVLLSRIKCGWLVTGPMSGRVFFQSAVMCRGRTGGMLSTSWVRLNGALLKLVLLWNGRLTISAIGFWDFLARSSSSSGLEVRRALGRATVSGMPASNL